MEICGNVPCPGGPSRSGAGAVGVIVVVVVLDDGDLEQYAMP